MECNQTLENIFLSQKYFTLGKYIALKSIKLLKEGKREIEMNCMIPRFPTLWSLEQIIIHILISPLTSLITISKHVYASMGFDLSETDFC